MNDLKSNIKRNGMGSAVCIPFKKPRIVSVVREVSVIVHHNWMILIVIAFSNNTNRNHNS